MAIRAKHVQDEIKKAEEATANATIVEKAIIKLLTLVLRVLLTARLNQVKIMEHFKIEKTQPRLPRTESKDEAVEIGEHIIGDGRKIEDAEPK